MIVVKHSDVNGKQRSVLWNVSLSGRYEMFIADATNHVYDRLQGSDAGLDFQSPPHPLPLTVFSFSKWKDL